MLELFLSLAEHNKDRLIRYPIVAGMYYPDDPETVEAALNTFGLGAKNAGGKAPAIIAPHGAWNLSGMAAAEAFRACGKRNPSRVVLLGMIHEGGNAGIFLSNSDSFHTPLGRISVDRNACEELASCSTIIEIDDTPHLREHSLEVLLPFIKHCFPAASIVPVLMGTPSRNRLKALSGALNVVFRDTADSTLFIISSCLSKASTEILAQTQADYFINALLEKDGEVLRTGIFGSTVSSASGNARAPDISACGAVLAAALLESRLLDGREARFLQREPEKIPFEGGYVCYGSIAFE